MNQRDWDPEIDGAAAREGSSIRRAFQSKKRRSKTPPENVKRNHRAEDVLAKLNVISGKATR